MLDPPPPLPPHVRTTPPHPPAPHPDAPPYAFSPTMPPAHTPHASSPVEQPDSPAMATRARQRTRGGAFAPATAVAPPVPLGRGSNQRGGPHTPPGRGAGAGQAAGAHAAAQQLQQGGPQQQGAHQGPGEEFPANISHESVTICGQYLLQLLMLQKQGKQGHPKHQLPPGYTLVSCRPNPNSPFGLGFSRPAKDMPPTSLQVGEGGGGVCVCVCVND